MKLKSLQLLKEMVLFVRLHQSHESVTVFQRDPLAFSRGDKNPKMPEQDRSFSFPVGKMMTARKLHSLSVCRAPGACCTPYPRCGCRAPLHKWCYTWEEHKVKQF